MAGQIGNIRLLQVRDSSIPEAQKRIIAVNIRNPHSGGIDRWLIEFRDGESALDAIRRTNAFGITYHGKLRTYAVTSYLGVKTEGRANADYDVKFDAFSDRSDYALHTSQDKSLVGVGLEILVLDKKTGKFGILEVVDDSGYRMTLSAANIAASGNMELFLGMTSKPESLVNPEDLKFSEWKHTMVFNNKEVDVSRALFYRCSYKYNVGLNDLFTQIFAQVMPAEFLNQLSLGSWSRGSRNFLAVPIGSSQLFKFGVIATPWELELLNRLKSKRAAQSDFTYAAMPAYMVVSNIAFGGVPYSGMLAVSGPEVMEADFAQEERLGQYHLQENPACNSPANSVGLQSGQLQNNSGNAFAEKLPMASSAILTDSKERMPTVLQRDIAAYVPPEANFEHLGNCMKPEASNAAAFASKHGSGIDSSTHIVETGEIRNAAGHSHLPNNAESHKNSGLAPAFGQVKAIIFDMDGVLADSEKLHLKSFRQVFAPYGVKISNKEWFANYIGTGSRHIVADLMARHCIDADASAMLHERKLLFQKYVQEGMLKPMPGALKLVEMARKRRIKIVVASGGHRQNVDAQLQALGLPGIKAVCLEDVKNRKPHPEAFEKAAEIIGVPAANCLVIEDSSAGVVAASRAGMRCLLVSRHQGQEVKKMATKAVPSLSSKSAMNWMSSLFWHAEKAGRKKKGKASPQMAGEEKPKPQAKPKEKPKPWEYSPPKRK